MVTKAQRCELHWGANVECTMLEVAVRTEVSVLRYTQLIFRRAFIEFKRQKPKSKLKKTKQLPPPPQSPG